MVEIKKDEFKELKEIGDKIEKATAEERLAVRSPEDRPPKKWWYNCISRAKRIGVDNPESFCGWMYFHGAEEGFGAQREAIGKSGKVKLKKSVLKNLITKFNQEFRKNRNIYKYEVYRDNIESNDNSSGDNNTKDMKVKKLIEPKPELPKPEDEKKKPKSEEEDKEEDLEEDEEADEDIDLDEDEDIEKSKKVVDEIIKTLLGDLKSKSEIETKGDNTMSEETKVTKTDKLLEELVELNKTLIKKIESMPEIVVQKIFDREKSPKIEAKPTGETKIELPKSQTGEMKQEKVSEGDVDNPKFVDKTFGIQKTERNVPSVHNLNPEIKQDEKSLIRAVGNQFTGNVRGYETPRPQIDSNIEKPSNEIGGEVNVKKIFEAVRKGKVTPKQIWEDFKSKKREQLRNNAII